MKKRLLTFPLLLSLASTLLLGVAAAQAQQTLNCGTPEPTEDQLRRMANDNLMSAGMRTGAAMQAPVPVQLTVVRNSSGQGRTLQQALDAFADACEAFRPTGLRFYLSAPVKFVNNTSLLSISSLNESLLCLTNDNLLAMNIYLVQTVNSGTTSGYAYVNYPPQTLMPRVIVGETWALAHEMGHSLGLLHTFNNNNNALTSLRERVNGSNCSTAGDLICDTPADPYGLSGATVSNCVYTGTVTDANGQRFNPPVGNAMSYYVCNGYNTFTDGQVARMAASRKSVWLTAISPMASAAAVNLSVSAPSFGYPVLSWSTSDASTQGYWVERQVGADTTFKIVAAVTRTAGSWIDSTAPGGQSIAYRLRNLQNPNVVSAKRSITSSVTYCQPDYTQFRGGCGMGLYTYMRRFTVKRGSTTLVNRVSDSCGTYTCYSPTANTTLPTGTALSLETELYAWTTGYIYPQFVSAWIDYDRDGIFEASERIYQGPGGSALKTGSFTIPATVSAGTTRLRVRSVYDNGSTTSNIDPCATNAYGETEDYIVKIGGTTVVTCAKPAAAVTVAGNRLSATPADSASYTYQWYSSGSAIGGATARSYYIAANGSYAVRLTRISGGCDSLSASVAATFTPATTTTSAVSSNTWRWVDRAYSSGADKLAVTRTAPGAGFVYSGGTYTGTLTLEGPTATGAASQTLAPAGGMDGLVQYRRKDGRLEWAMRLAGTGTDEVLDLTVDAAGNAYIVGAFTGTMTVSPVSGTAVTLTSAGGSDAFLAKVSNTGALAYAFRFGGTGNDRAESVALTPTSTIMVGGSFSGTVAFKGTGSGSLSRTAVGGTDAFMVKFANAGNTLYYVAQVGGAGNDVAYAVRCDKSQNAYMAGSFADSATFSSSAGGSVKLKSAGGNDGFVYRCSSTGAYSQAVRLGGTQSDYVKAIAIDPASTGILATGAFSGTATFGAKGNLVSLGGYDAFAARLTATTLAVEWATRAGGSGLDQGTAITTYKSGNTLVSINFTGKSTHFGGTSTVLTSAGSTDGLVAKLNATSGLPMAATQLGGTGTDNALGVDTADGDTFYAVGLLGTSGKVGSSFGPYTDAGSGDGFVARCGTTAYIREGLYDEEAEIPVQVLTAAKAVELHLFPNPVQDQVTLRLSSQTDAAAGQQATIHILDGSGRSIRSAIRTLQELEEGTRLEPAGLTPGLYILQVETATGQRHTARMLKK